MTIFNWELLGTFTYDWKLDDDWGHQCRMNMVRVRVATCLLCYCALSIDEFVDVALGTGYAQDFDLNVDLHSVEVDYVASPTTKLSDAKRHPSLLSSFLSNNSL